MERLNGEPERLKNKTFLCQCDVMGGFSVLVIEEFDDLGLG